MIIYLTTKNKTKRKISEKRIKESEAPSSIAKPRNWTKGQGSDPIYLNHRPADAFGNPITLQHPVFATFIKDCEDITPNDVDYAFVLELVNSMSNVFEDEDARKDEFKRLYRKHYNISFIGYENKKTITDGSTFSKGNMYMTSNLEAKPEMGVGNCCPYIQSNAYYAKYITTLPISIVSTARLPCFLLYLIG